MAKGASASKRRDETSFGLAKHHLEHNSSTPSGLFDKVCHGLVVVAGASNYRYNE
jgi:hypothetical protein